MYDLEATLAAELSEAPPDLEATLEADEAAEESEDEIEDAALCAAAEALDAEALSQVSKALVTGRATAQTRNQLTRRWMKRQLQPKSHLRRRG